MIPGASYRHHLVILVMLSLAVVTPATAKRDPAAGSPAAPRPAAAAPGPFGLSCDRLPEEASRSRGCCYRPPMMDTGLESGVQVSLTPFVLQTLIADATRRKARVVFREETLRFLGVIPERVDKDGKIVGEGSFRDLTFPTDFAGVPSLMGKATSKDADPRSAGAADGYRRLTAALIDLLLRHALKNESVPPAPDQQPTYQNLDRKTACQLVGAVSSSVSGAFPRFDDYLKDLVAAAAAKR